MEESGDAGEERCGPPGGGGFELTEAGLAAEDAGEVCDGAGGQGDENDGYDGEQHQVERTSGVLGQIAPGEHAGHRGTVLPSTRS